MVDEEKEKDRTDRKDRRRTERNGEERYGSR